MRARHALLLVLLGLAVCVSMAAEMEFERDDDEGLIEDEREGAIRAIEIPKSLDPYFVKTAEGVRSLKLRFKLPQEEGKTVVTFTTTGRETAIMGSFKSNTKIKCDTGLNGRLTSTFGWFGYEINQILERDTHKMTFYFIDVKNVRSYYRAKDFSQPAPYMDVEITLSSTNEDILKVERILAENASSTKTEILK